MKKIALVLLAIAPAAFAADITGFRAASSGSQTNITVTTNSLSSYTPSTSAMQLRLFNVSGVETVTIGVANSVTSGKGFATMAPGGSITWDSGVGIVPQCTVYLTMPNTSTNSIATNTVTVSELDK